MASVNRWTLFAATLALALIAPSSHASTGRAFVTGALAGVAFFVPVVGLRIVNPVEVEWLLRLDWQWHYLA